MDGFNINFFLESTYYCDYRDSNLQKIIDEHKTRYYDHKDLSKSFFYFVRDHIKYRVGNWNKKASETILEKSGTCTNNANLFVALCRGAGIPAGYGIMDVNGREYFGKIAPNSLTKFVSKKSKHVYAYVFLKGRWIKCDPSDDKELSINTEHLNIQSTLIEWDGENDAVLKLDQKHILKDSGLMNNIDHIIHKKQRKVLYLPVKLANLYIDFLRLEGKNVHNISDLEYKFKIWLGKNYKIHLLNYIVIDAFSKIYH
jgi:hypothetical protein